MSAQTGVTSEVEVAGSFHVSVVCGDGDGNGDGDAARYVVVRPRPELERGHGYAFAQAGGGPAVDVAVRTSSGDLLDLEAGGGGCGCDPAPYLAYGSPVMPGLEVSYHVRERTPGGSWVVGCVSLENYAAEIGRGASGCVRVAVPGAAPVEAGADVVLRLCGGGDGDAAPAPVVVLPVRDASPRLAGGYAWCQVQLERRSPGGDWEPVLDRAPLPAGAADAARMALALDTTDDPRVVLGDVLA